MKSKSSYLLAGAVALAVAGWMLSDDLFGKADGTHHKIRHPPSAAFNDYSASGNRRIWSARKWIIGVGS